MFDTVEDARQGIADGRDKSGTDSERIRSLGFRKWAAVKK